MGQLFCSQCGSKLPENANVCPQCGKPVNNQTVQQQAQPQYQQQPQPQYQQPQYQQQAYYRQPADNGGNKGLLYAIIGLLAALLIGGAAYYFISQSNEKDAAQAEQLELLKQQQEELANKNKELEEKNEKLAEENAKKPAETKVIVQKPAEHAAEHRAVSAGGSKAKVVINGTGVRLRFAPSLNAGYLTWSNGQTRAPSKGARLEYTGEDGDWYQVKYLGHTFYVSKEFSYLEY